MDDKGPPTSENIRPRIQRVVTDLQVSTEKPDISVEKLVLIALVCTDQPMDADDIFQWIANNFNYYSKLISIGFLESIGQRRESEKLHEAEHFLQAIEGVMETDEIPLARTKEGGKIFVKLEATSAVPLLYPYGMASGQEKRKGADFFGLPAELRIDIYDMVFGYPDSALLFPSPSKKRWRKTLDIIKSQATPNDILQQCKRRCYETKFTPRTRSIEGLLAPLLTSRQFYAEAMPAFYRLNNFCFCDMEALHAFLDPMTQSQRECLTSLSVIYHPWNSKNGPKTFKMLANMANLTTLQLDVEEEKWLNKLFGNGQIKASQSEEERCRVLRKMPGFTALRSIRGIQNASFRGPCPRLEAMIRPEITKARLSDKSGSKNQTKKRKDVEGDPGASSSRLAKKARLG